MSKLESEDVIVVAIVVVGIAGGAVASLLDEKPIITAVLLGLGISAAIYRFLGGVDGAVFTSGPVRLGGTAAVLVATTFFINGALVEQVTISPPPGTWLAIHQQGGHPVDVELNGRPIPSAERDLLRDLSWTTHFDETGLRLHPRDDDAFAFGYVGLQDLRSFDLFNSMEPPGIFRFTGRLSAGQRDVDLDPYPLRLDVGTFSDGLSRYALVGLDGDVRYRGSLRNKTADVVRLDGRYFLVVVVSADHNSAEKWVNFGFGELRPSLEAPLAHDVSDLAGPETP